MLIHSEPNSIKERSKKSLSIYNEENKVLNRNKIEKKMEVLMRRHALKFLEKLKFAEEEIPTKNPFPVPVRRPSSDFLEI